MTTQRPLRARRRESDRVWGWSHHLLSLLKKMRTVDESGEQLAVGE